MKGKWSKQNEHLAYLVGVKTKNVKNKKKKQKQKNNPKTNPEQQKQKHLTC